MDNYGVPVQKKTNEWSIVSLIGGIAGLSFLPFIGALFGIIGGSIAKKQIKESAGTQEGEELAKWGTVLGWIGISLSVLAACAGVVLLIMFWNVVVGWITG